jgi:hypothetical protein
VACELAIASPWSEADFKKDWGNDHQEDDGETQRERKDAAGQRFGNMDELFNADEQHQQQQQQQQQQQPARQDIHSLQTPLLHRSLGSGFPTRNGMPNVLRLKTGLRKVSVARRVYLSLLQL